MLDSNWQIDDALVARVARGETGAAQTLVARQLPRILALAYRMLGDVAAAEDVAQETLLRAWREAPRWRPGRARFDTWMHRVAINLCYDRLRRTREVLTAEPPDRPDPQLSAEARLHLGQRAARVAAAVLALPERQREAVVLCHYQELGNIEAGQVMGISVEAVESLLSRGRRTLRSVLADLMDEA